MRQVKRYAKDIYQKIITRPKIAFIHIPKTGGTYINQFESGEKPVLHPLKNLGHSTILASEHLNNPQEILPSKSLNLTIPYYKVKKYKIFTVVRNVYDWLVSYAGHAGVWSSKYLDKNHYDYEHARKGFEYLIETIANREYPWPSKRFLFSQIFRSDGKLIVDYIARTKSLDNDLCKFAANNDITYNRKKPQRKGKRKKEYREYYNKDLKSLVATTWSREIELFGFAYGNDNRKNGGLASELDKETKSQISYDFKNDKLTNNMSKINKHQ